MNTATVMLQAKDPLDIAVAYRLDGGSYVCWQGELFRWNGIRYVSFGNDAVRSDLYGFIQRCELATGTRITPNRRLVTDVIDALQALCFLDIPRAPWWLGEEGAVPADDLLACANGLVNLRTRELLEPSPLFFNTAAVGFDFDPSAPKPERWIEFLTSIWSDDQESIDALAEWVGLALTDITDFQKALLIVGPKRSGKGTILRVLREIAGHPNVVSPTLASLGLPFGLQSLIGRRVGIVSDARLSHRADMAAVAENLLRITGQDAVSVPRKFLPDWHGQLTTRFILATNELPGFSDASAALASRFIVLRMQRSFFGHEDPHLTEKLLQELPGIFMWALDGLDRLRERGRLLQPRSGQELVDELEASTSPIGEFVRERCIVSPTTWVACDRLFDAWREWCREQGRDHPGTVQQFGRQLRAACPEIRITQPRIGGGRERRYEGIRLRSSVDVGTHWNASETIAHDAKDKSKERNGVVCVPSRANYEPITEKESTPC